MALLFRPSWNHILISRDILSPWHSSKCLGGVWALKRVYYFVYILLSHLHKAVNALVRISLIPECRMSIKLMFYSCSRLPKHPSYVALSWYILIIILLSIDVDSSWICNVIHWDCWYSLLTWSTAVGGERESGSSLQSPFPKGLDTVSVLYSWKPSS